MAACWCSLAGTAACQHCQNNPMATDVWTNKTVTVNHVEIGKPQTNADRIRSMTDDELLKFIKMVYGNGRAGLSPTNGFEEWLNKPNSLDEMEDGHYYIMKDGILYKAKVATPEEMGAKTFNIKEYIENGDK